MPEISIILPTYNRADTLPRAIRSVLSQTISDWELIVVDDGSTDNTAQVLQGIDNRIRVLRIENSGCYAARNHGLRTSQGRFITFLDSDDEWLPHYLELTTAFFAAFPDEQYVMTEFWADWGSGVLSREFRGSIKRMWHRAREIGSDSLDLAEGETDENLRVYETREPLGIWGQDIAVRAGYESAFLYRGKISQHYRWEGLGWCPSTMLTRKALETVGLYPEDYRIAADFRFFVRLSQAFRTNMIAVPCGIKHDAGANRHPLSEGHLASGANEYRYATNRLALFEDMFATSGQLDSETGRIHGLYQLYAGRTALELAMRDQAIFHLQAATKLLPDHQRARWLLVLVNCIPSGPLASSLYAAWLRTKAIFSSILTGRLTIREFAKRIFRKIIGNS